MSDCDTWYGDIQRKSTGSIFSPQTHSRFAQLIDFSCALLPTTNSVHRLTLMITEKCYYLFHHGKSPCCTYSLLVILGIEADNKFSGSSQDRIIFSLFIPFFVPLSLTPNEVAKSHLWFQKCDKFSSLIPQKWQSLTLIKCWYHSHDMYKVIPNSKLVFPEPTPGQP